MSHCCDFPTGDDRRRLALRKSQMTGPLLIATFSNMSKSFGWEKGDFSMPIYITFSWKYESKIKKLDRFVRSISLVYE